MTSGPRTQMDLSVDVGRGLQLRNPVTAASGAFGFGVEHADWVDVERLGAIFTRGTTLRSHRGNGSPRIAETPAGLLNSVGLQNPGVDAVLERYADRWAEWTVPVIVNVAAQSVDDYVELAKRLDGRPGVAGIELNLSCPNADDDGLEFALDADAAGRVTAAVRDATELPLIAKLSPAAADVRTVARAIADAGADAISAVNTLPGIALDRDARRPAFATGYGGLSGPALKPIALRIVLETAQVVKVPVLGVGGIHSIADVLDFLMAGAAAVQVGTALFADPELPLRLSEELADWCHGHRYGSHREIVGAALPARRLRPSTKGAEYRL